jgi:hypothetical protein
MLLLCCAAAVLWANMAQADISRVRAASAVVDRVIAIDTTWLLQI